MQPGSGVPSVAQRFEPRCSFREIAQQFRARHDFAERSREVVEVNGVHAVCSRRGNQSLPVSLDILPAQSVQAKDAHHDNIIDGNYDDGHHQLIAGVVAS